MLKKIFILLFFIAPIGAFAQDKLAYINTDEVFAKMPELGEVEKKLTEKQDEIKKMMESLQGEYNNKLEQYKNSSDSLSEAVIVERQAELQKIEERFQTYLESSDKAFQELRQQLLAPLQQKFQQTLKSVGDEQGFAYILEAGAARYISPKAVDAAPFVKTKLGIK